MNEIDNAAALERRGIRSFVLRQGRLTRGQERALTELAPQFVITHPEQIGQSYRVVQPLVLEIGFGNGQALATCAGTDAQRNYLGAEVHGPGVGQLLLAIEAQALENVRIWHGDAVLLLQRLPDSSLDEVRIWFPDPWHKARHHKRRLIQSPLVALLCQKLTSGGLLHCATDWQPYAEHILSVLQAEPTLSNTAADYAMKPAWRPETHFERRGLKLGHGVFDLLFKRS